MNKRSKKKIAPIVAAVLVVVYLLPITGGLAAAAGLLGATEEWPWASACGRSTAGRKRMPKNTENAQAQRRREAIWSAVVSTVMRLLMAAVLLWLRWGRDGGSFLSKLLVVVLVLELGSIVPIWINLKKRLEEIQGGEEDAAAQY